MGERLIDTDRPIEVALRAGSVERCPVVDRLGVWCLHESDAYDRRFGSHVVSHEPSGRAAFYGDLEAGRAVLAHLGDRVPRVGASWPKRYLPIEWSLPMVQIGKAIDDIRGGVVGTWGADARKAVVRRG
jgi:hypothetical protein